MVFRILVLIKSEVYYAKLYGSYFEIKLNSQLTHALKLIAIGIAIFFPYHSDFYIHILRNTVLHLQ